MNKQTAKYVVNKIYKEFVNETPDKNIVEKLAEEFFNSGYDIGKLMFSIFNSEWFYDDKNIGVRITSPVELLVRYKKLVALKILI